MAAGPTLNNYLFISLTLSFPGLVYDLNSNFLALILNVDHRSTRFPEINERIFVRGTKH